MPSKYGEIRLNMNAYIDGVGKAGVATELTPPKIAFKTEEYQGAGMDAPVEIVVGMEKLEASYTLNEYTSKNFAMCGALRKDSKGISFRGSIDTGEGKKKEVHTMRGITKEADMGSMKAGEKGEGVKYVSTLDYYKLEIGDKVVIEIDILNSIRIIDGVDQLAEQRDALGL